jgi:hypothetical protein
MDSTPAVVITTTYPVTPITSLCEPNPGVRLFSEAGSPAVPNRETLTGPVRTHLITSAADPFAPAGRAAANHPRKADNGTHS